MESPWATLSKSASPPMGEPVSPAATLHRPAAPLGEPVDPAATMRVAIPESPDVYVTLVSPGVSCEESCTGDFWVRELNREALPVFVRKLDFSAISKQAIGMATGAGAGDILFRGVFGPTEISRAPIAPPTAAVPTFYVHEAWRGLPDVTAPSLELYTDVVTVDGHLVAHMLNSPWGRPIEAVSVTDVTPAWVDGAWITTRVMYHDAIIASRFDGGTLVAGQVFLRLPDVIGPCPLLRWMVPACEGGQVETYAMTDDLCEYATGCAKPGVCPMFVPRCDPGYDLVSWPTQPDACAVFTCEPAFASQ